MCVREASLVPRSYTCCALPHAAVTSRSYKKAKETAVRDIPSPNGYRRCTVPGRHPNIYWVDRVRARCAIRARLLGARSQELEMVLRVFQLLPSSIHTTSYIRTYRTFAVVPEGGISQLHISHLGTYMHASPGKSYNELRT